MKSLKEKIDDLPADLQQKVIEYIEFLLYQRGEVLQEGETLTTAQKEELDARLKRYEEHPDDVVSFDELKKRILKKHG